MEALGEKAKQAQDDLSKKLDEGKKAAGEALDKLKDKAKEVTDKVKEKLTPETLQEIKAITAELKEILSNLPIDVPGGLQKLLDKLDKLIEKLDPVNNSIEAAETDARALREVVNAELIPFIDLVIDIAKRDVDLYFRRLSLVGDLMLLLERELDQLPTSGPAAEGESQKLFAAGQPCPNPKPPNEVQIDKVPPGRAHWPCKGDHWHCLEYHQRPFPDCKIFKKRKFGGCIPPPAPANC